MTAPERIWVADRNHPDGTREYIRADLAAVPAQVKVKPLDLSNALKHAFISGRVSAGAASSFHADAWAEYDPTESAGYARILASIEPQPDPRDEVITRLVDALEWYSDEVMAYAITQANEPRSAVHGDKGKRARAALAAAKAVQHG